MVEKSIIQGIFIASVKNILDYFPLEKAYFFTKYATFFLEPFYIHTLMDYSISSSVEITLLEILTKHH